MKCKDCYARNDSEKCLIGKKPRMLVCGHYGCDLQKKTVEKKMGIYTQTNGDKIRQMSDEELAAWFGASESFCPPGCYETNDCDACPEICTGHWMAWLKQEAFDD